MDLHSSFIPAIAADSPAQSADAVGLSGEPLLVDMAFEGLLATVDPADRPDNGAVAPESTPQILHPPLSAPDPVSSLVEVLTGISSEMPVGSVERPLSAADINDSTAVLPVDGDRSERTAPPVAGRTTPADSATTPELPSQALHVKLQVSQLPSALPTPSLHSTTTLTHASKASEPVQDEWNQQDTPPSRLPIAAPDDQPVPDERPAPSRPALGPVAKNPAPTTRDPASKDSAALSGAHPPGLIVPRSAAAPFDGDLPTSHLVARHAGMAAQVTHAPDTSGHTIKMTQEDLLRSRPERLAVSLRRVDARETGQPPAPRDAVTANLEIRNAASEIMTNVIAATDESGQPSDGLSNNLRALPIRELPVALQALAQPEARISPANPASFLRQVADAIVTTRNDVVEITLSPEELGRVRMVLTGPERAPHLLIWAERPDILDQMRRNADFLMQEFRDEGLADATLSFHDNRDHGHHDMPEDDLSWEDRDPDEDDSPAQLSGDPKAGHAPMIVTTHRIDVRM